MVSSYQSFTDDLLTSRFVLFLFGSARGGGGGGGGRGGVGVLPYISHIGICRPIGYGFCADFFDFENQYSIVVMAR